jgi:MoxR-like ATPase
MEGTYPLPEAQRDRFTARISLGYPNRQAEIAMLGEHAAVDPLLSLEPVSTSAEVRALIAGVRDVHVADALKAYAVDLAEATRRSRSVRLGASPRATLHLLRTAKAWAAMEGRNYVLPDDLQFLLSPVLAHRLLLSAEAQLAGTSADQVLNSIVPGVALPDPRSAAASNGHLRPRP